jgi:hypothetical protein
MMQFFVWRRLCQLAFSVCKVGGLSLFNILFESGRLPSHVKGFWKMISFTTKIFIHWYKKIITCIFFRPATPPFNIFYNLNLKLLCLLIGGVADVIGMKTLDFE